MPRRIHPTALLTLMAALTLAGTQLGSPALAREAERDRDAAALLADQFVIMMGDALEGDASPRPDQFRRAQILIDQALALRDDDAELWRLRAELADRMEDRDAYRNAMRRYIRLRPSDDVAQLERLLEGLSEAQTLDERLARVEAILQAGSTQQLSSPLRSRLATHAALAAQELGDDSRRDRWLAEALRLDPVNPDAAELAYARAQREGASATERGRALIHMVKAGPADPTARLRLARWLATQAAYEPAEQQFGAATMLAVGPLPVDIYPYWVIALAASGNADGARQALDQLAPIRQPNDANDQRRGIDPETYPDVRLSLEMIRLALLTDQPEPAERSFSRIRTLVEASFSEDDLPDWLDGPDAPSPEQGRQLMLAWIAAVFNQQQQPDQVTQLLAELPEADPLVRRARGWVHVHRGEADAAVEQLEPIADDDPLAALGLARLLVDGSDQQVESLQSIVQRDGAGIAGLIAARRLLADGHPLPETDAGRSVRREMNRGPLQLWQPALNVSPWTIVHLRVAPQQVGYLEPLHATLELRNTSRMPMPIQTGRGIPDRALLSPSPSVGGERLPRPAPAIVDVRRRLTLEPGETLRVSVRLDRSQLGQLMLSNPTRTMSVNVLGVLGPRPTRAGGVAPEPVGSADAVRAITVRGTPLTEQRINDWLAELDSDEPTARLRALAQLLRGIDHLPDELDTQAVRRRIADAVSDRVAAWGALDQAWAVRFLTRSDRSRQLFRRVLDTAERSDEPLVRLAFMATHLDGSASSALNAALRHEDELIRSYAEALRDAAEARDEAAAESGDAGREGR